VSQGHGCHDHGLGIGRDRAASNERPLITRAGNIGLPLPGCAAQLIPGAKTEAPVRGPNVTPGY
jgi:hypothetical protein